MGLPILFARKKKFNPLSLFAAGEQGVWYDPSDWTTLFQDSAGTTPVTAIEQPVGLILDKSGRGNHAFQSTTTSRPILRNRYNLLTYTEQFDNGVWGNGRQTVTTNVPVSGLTPDRGNCNETGGGGMFIRYGMSFYGQTPISITSGASYTLSTYAYKGSRSQYAIIIATSDATSIIRAFFNLDSGTFVDITSVGSNVVLVGTPSIVSVPGYSGWYRVSLTCTVNSSTMGLIIVPSVTSSADLSCTSGVDYGYYLGTSLVVANESHLPYQWVTTGAQSTSNPVSTVTAGYDTDVTKFPPYLFFDGSDDWLSTANINFSATDKMSVFAGVRKLSDAADAWLIELSVTAASNSGTFLAAAPGGNGVNKFGFGSRGTGSISYALNTDTSNIAPITRVMSCLSSISGDSVILRLNGLQTNSSSADQGTGNFGTYPLYIGARYGTTTRSLFFFGRIYSLIIRGALTSSPQLEKTEKWVAGKTGVTL